MKIALGDRVAQLMILPAFTKKIKVVPFECGQNPEHYEENAVEVYPLTTEARGTRGFGAMDRLAEISQPGPSRVRRSPRFETPNDGPSPPVPIDFTSPPPPLTPRIFNAPLFHHIRRMYETTDLARFPRIASVTSGDITVRRFNPNERDPDNQIEAQSNKVVSNPSNSDQNVLAEIPLPTNRGRTWDSAINPRESTDQADQE